MLLVRVIRKLKNNLALTTASYSAIILIININVKTLISILYHF